MSSTDLREFYAALSSGEVEASGVEQCQECDHAEVVKKWRMSFAFQLHQATGDWRLGGYDWHVFTYGYADALSGPPAIDRYQKLRTTTSGYVFSHTVRKPLCCSTNRLPSHAAIDYALSLFRELADIYVVDREFKWTFVVTHEQSAGIGPFFSCVLKR